MKDAPDSQPHSDRQQSTGVRHGPAGRAQAENVRIVLDAYGGDYAPQETVRGAVLAAESMPETTIVLTGPAQELEAELDQQGGRAANIRIVEAPQSIGMHEVAVQALRGKRDSSISVGVKLVAEGQADAFVSAGNTGAVVAASSLEMGLLEGVHRPGIAVPMRAIDHPLVAIDVGANIHCRAVHLLQYGIMATVFASEVLRIENPRVGLLNVGQEAGKGTELTKRAFEMLSEAQINFVGNVEGHDLFFGGCDIVVCDGFVGNVLLKVGENIVMKLLDWFRAEIKKSIRRRIGFALCRELFENLKYCADYSEYGGAPLLGIKGITIIGHGRSDAKAIENAIREARSFVQLRVNEKITLALSGGAGGR